MHLPPPPCLLHAPLMSLFSIWLFSTTQVNFNFLMSVLYLLQNFSYSELCIARRRIGTYKESTDSSFSCVTLGTHNRGAFTNPFLPWKSNKYYIFLCVSVRVRVSGCARALACDCARVVLLIEHATRMRHIAICSPSGSTIFFDIIS